MTNKLLKFDAGSLEKGIDTYGPDFSSELALTPQTSNVSTGINAGLGVRYGMAPIPGQQHTEYNSSTQPVGLRQTEGASNLFSYSDRLRVYGVIPITENFPGAGSLGAQTYYIWIVGSAPGGTPRVDFVMSSAQSSTLTLPAADIASGLGYAMISGISNTYHYYQIPFYNVPLRTSTTFISDIGDLFSGYAKNYISFADMTVSGSNVDMNWVYYLKQVNATSTNTANGNFTASPSTPEETGGIPSSVNNNNYPVSRRSIRFYDIYTHGTYGTALAYVYNYDNNDITSGVYVPTYNNDLSTQSIDLSKLSFTNRTTRQDGTTPAESSINRVLLYDPEMFTNTAYKIFFIAAKKPIAGIIQGWNSGPYGYPFQLVDLTAPCFYPSNDYTDNQLSHGNSYTENGSPAITGWNSWPAWAAGTPLIDNASSPRDAIQKSLIALGPEDSGVLRKNTTYEFAYSIYNKQFGTETNVCAPAKVETGDDDFVAISIYRDIFVTAAYRQTVCSLDFPNVSPPFRFKDIIDTGTSRIHPINYIQYRVYYRELGSYEWLPALFVDASKYHFYPDFRELWMCQSPIASLPGGQPGGFIDYSPLPQDEYICVFVYKGRTFWISKSNLVFSLQNNPFAYPLRNNAPAPTGGYRGAIVHTYRGQSEQESRLVIFGSKETYIGKFTGNLEIQPVVVSPDNIASYPLDGSDFVIETWTSVTAFSFRSAVVADGDLYMWGEQGVYLDNGVTNPTKISDYIEPDIFNLYTPDSTQEIHATYNNKTKEISWFYTPKDAPTVSHALILNIDTRQFYIERFNSKIDWSEQIDTTNSQTSQGTNSLRTIIGVRANSSATLQRAYFYDIFNRSGDLEPGTEFVVKKVEAGASSTQKVLTLATGYDGTNFATIATGDYLAIQQHERYTGTPADDIVAKIVSTDTMAGKITISIPSGTVLPNETLGVKTYFPVWQRGALTAGLNGIEWSINSKYWMPKGVNFSGIWLYLYLFFKYTPWAKVDPTFFELAYRTPSGADFISDTVLFANNSDFNCQVYHPLRPNDPNGGRNNNGQAIRFLLSGIHIGEEWVLQYMQLQGNDETGNPLIEYEG
jgi:hypothetical protein